jgi:ADP-heptose:LPS heptosyltransferase
LLEGGAAAVARKTPDPCDPGEVGDQRHRVMSDEQVKFTFWASLFESAPGWNSEGYIPQVFEFNCQDFPSVLHKPYMNASDFTPARLFTSGQGAKQTQTKGFLERTRLARKVMVLDLGFLGDTIHLIPALEAVRLGYPEAELHVMVADHVREMLQTTPWVDRVWGYPRFPKSPSWPRLLGRIRQLRAERFDVVINLNGSDRSSILTFLSGAPARLGRRPEKGGPWFWDFLFTDIVEFPYKTMPISKQRWECVKAAGFPGDKPVFNIQIPEGARQTIREKIGSEASFVHVSPFTTEDQKELPLEILAETLNELMAARPRMRMILSCAPNEREKSRMNELLKKLHSVPWHVFGGELNLLELAALMQRSGLHLGGDSGALHVAWMVGVPTVSWFREYDGIKDWMPDGSGHRVLIGRAAASGLQGIKAGGLVQSVLELAAISGFEE